MLHLWEFISSRIIGVNVDESINHYCFHFKQLT